MAGNWDVGGFGTEAIQRYYQVDQQHAWVYDSDADIVEPSKKCVYGENLRAIDTRNGVAGIKDDMFSELENSIARVKQ